MFLDRRVKDTIEPGDKKYKIVAIRENEEQSRPSNYRTNDIDIMHLMPTLKAQCHSSQLNQSHDKSSHYHDRYTLLVAAVAPLQAQPTPAKLAEEEAVHARSKNFCARSLGRAGGSASNDWSKRQSQAKKPLPGSMSAKW